MTPDHFNLHTVISTVCVLSTGGGGCMGVGTLPDVLLRYGLHLIFLPLEEEVKHKEASQKHCDGLQRLESPSHHQSAVKAAHLPLVQQETSP